MKVFSLFTFVVIEASEIFGLRHLINKRQPPGTELTIHDPWEKKGVILQCPTSVFHLHLVDHAIFLFWNDTWGHFWCCDSLRPDSLGSTFPKKAMENTWSYGQNNTCIVISALNQIFWELLDSFAHDSVGGFGIPCTSNAYWLSNNNIFGELSLNLEAIVSWKTFGTHAIQQIN